MADVTIKGSSVILFLHDGTAYLPIGCLTSNSTTESVETTAGTITKCNQNPEPILGAYSYTKSFEAEAVEDDGTKMSIEEARTLLRAKVASKEPIYWKEEITKANATKVTEYGKGYLTELGSEAPAEGMVTFSGTISGIGAISQTDLVPTTTTTTTV